MSIATIQSVLKTLFLLITIVTQVSSIYYPERVSKIPFGLYVSPENSPVNSDRFKGYHTAFDFEVFDSELDKEVPVNTICEGTLLVKRFATGYGGVIVQQCVFNNQDITVVYGHLDLKSIPYSIGDTVKSGAFLGVLGEGFSEETDSERKHLHLGIHKGTEIDIRGYVQTEEELEQWISPAEILYN